MLRFAYVSQDEVNAEFARKLAARCGVLLTLCDPRSPCPMDHDFVLLDLDHLPVESASRLIAEGLRAGKHRLAIHGYNLPPEIRHLRQQGVTIQRRLRRVFFRLRQALPEIPSAGS